ncbi:hypothetical protein RBRAMI_5364 [Pseudomonas aeruginosa RB]|nr:hypothetical protein RBRAMI_5364 [Pseudomonas aeruginosa RB]
MGHVFFRDSMQRAVRRQPAITADNREAVIRPTTPGKPARHS